MIYTGQNGERAFGDDSLRHRACSRLVQPLASRLQRPEPNRGTPELESLLTRCRINARTTSNRGQFGHPMRMAVPLALNEREGSEQREPKALFRTSRTRFRAVHREYACGSMVETTFISNRLRRRLEFAVTPCKQTAERISNRRKSAISSCPQIGAHLPLGAAFLIANPRLEAHLNPSAPTNRSPLIANFCTFFRLGGKRLQAACTGGRKLPTMMHSRMKRRITKLTNGR